MAVTGEPSGAGGPDAPSPQAAAAAQINLARQRLRQAMQQRLDADRLPYEGQWLSPEELAARLRTERRRSRVRALELLLLLLFGTALSLLILGILNDLVY